MLNGSTHVFNTVLNSAKFPTRQSPSRFTSLTHRGSHTMTSQTNGVPVTESAPRKLKILMLHGYTQSGPLFHAKTRALEKALHKAFPPAFPATTRSSSSSSSISKPKPLPPTTLPSHPGGIELIYPSGPRHLRAADIPGFTPTPTTSSSTDPNDTTTTTTPADEPYVPDSRAWWQRNDHTGEYDGLEDGLRAIAAAITAAGGAIDGVVGFSQGGAAAALVASLLERERASAFAFADGDGAGDEVKTKAGLPYPPSFRELRARTRQPPLKFAVAYSAFRAPGALYGPFYEPKIATPTLHFVGSLDTVVEEGRSLALVEACVEPKVVYHPGGHFVPIGKEMVGALVGFIRQCCEEEEDEGLEESVEDMDVPF